MKNVIVLGGAYGGCRAAQILAKDLPDDYRVILIDRNTHVNHLYVMPRYGVVPGHEHKAFIPYTNVFNTTDPNSVPTTPTVPDQSPPSSTSSSRHIVLHAQVQAISPQFVTLDRAFPEHGIDSPQLPYKYAVYALGSHLPAPINLWAPAEDEQVMTPYSGTKQEAIAWLKRLQERIAKARSVLVVGGGALGIQFATDIASHDPSKQVTLLHSRQRLLPKFDPDLHSEIVKSMEDLRIDVILGERLDLSSTTRESAKHDASGQRIVRTLKGREIAADFILLCTGQIPNTEMLREMDPKTVDPSTKLAHVLPTMQLGVIAEAPKTATPTTPTDASSIITGSIPPTPIDGGNDLAGTLRDLSIAGSENENETDQYAEVETTPYPHIFVVGDAADAFGAVKAGHNAYFQAEVAANNILKLVKHDSESPTVELDHYTPGLPAIKLSLGLGQRSIYEFNGSIGRKDELDAEDLDAKIVWRFFGVDVKTDEDMYL